MAGTGLTQAVPLTLAAALGALAFGHVEFAVTASIALGTQPPAPRAGIRSAGRRKCQREDS